MISLKFCKQLFKIILLSIGYLSIFACIEPNPLVYSNIYVQSFVLTQKATNNINDNNNDGKIIGENQAPNIIKAIVEGMFKPNITSIPEVKPTMSAERIPPEKEKKLDISAEEIVFAPETEQAISTAVTPPIKERSIQSAEQVASANEKKVDKEITPAPAPTAIANIQSEAGYKEVVSQLTPENSMFICEVKDIIEQTYKKYPLKNYGLYIKEFSTGFEFGVNENLTYYDQSDGNTDGYFRAASVVKLQMAYVSYRLIEKGELEEDKTWVDDVTGKEQNILTCLHTMVSRSDNNLFNTMLRLVGREKVNETLIEYGVLNSPIYGEINPSIGYSRENNLNRHGTEKVGGKITPKDMGIILDAVFCEKENNPYMKYFNKALLANIYSSRIPKGINNKYPVAHKTGTSEDFGVYNDAGIVYCKNPYILVVLTKGESPSSAHGFIRELAKLLTQYMDNRVKL